MISCFNSESNSFNQNYLNNCKNSEKKLKYIQSLMPVTVDNNCKCPKCGAKNKLSYHASYQRNIAFVIDENIENFRIIVTRLICKSCGSTHALLPNFIIPYKIMSLHGILNIIQNSILNSVLTISSRLNISYQIIYEYLSLFLSFFGNVAILNNSKEYWVNFNQQYFLENALSFSEEKFLIDFLEYHKLFFLMTKFRNISPPLIYCGCHEMATT